MIPNTCSTICTTHVLLALALIPLAGCSGKWTSTPREGTPVALHGRLAVQGLQLVDQHGTAIQLRGASFFWINWEQHNLQPSAATFMARELGASVTRIPVPAFDYARDPGLYDMQISTMIGWARRHGLYSIIDWHVVGDPAQYTRIAGQFWDKMAERWGESPDILFEIANEPTGVAWSDGIKPYAMEMIAIIRRKAPHTIVIVGTPEWSRRLQQPADDPITVDIDGRPATNIMYAYHGYAASHGMKADVEPFIGRLPIFVTEWGVSSATGDGETAMDKSAEFVRYLRENPVQKVSWCQWSWVDKRESSALLQPGTGGLTWQLSEPGDSCRSWIRTDPGTAFPGFTPTPWQPLPLDSQPVQSRPVPAPPALTPPGRSLPAAGERR